LSIEQLEEKRKFIVDMLLFVPLGHRDGVWHMYVKTAIGQDSHRFAFQAAGGGGDAAGGAGCEKLARRPLLLGGAEFFDAPPLMGNSDADVVLHALCNAVSGITGVNILGEISDKMCFRDGITDSAEYVKEAMKYLAGGRIYHASFAIECARPAISPRIIEMRKNIAEIIGTDADDVCITATSGEGLTDFGRGLGIQVFAIINVCYNIESL
jgi:2-C-methyl-D-erythritol 2,4-cyclodiphosphate synthase